MKLQSDLGKEYAQALDARAISEIATWCEMAFNGLIGHDDANEQADRQVWRQAALALRALQEHAHTRTKK